MTKTQLPALSFKEFQTSVSGKQRRFPDNGQWELTFRCNYRCQHCYIPPEDLAGRSKEKDLTTEESFRLMDQFEQAGVLSLTLTGGDPLLRRDFLEIYLYGKKKGFLLTIFTNGSLLTDRIADTFQKHPPFRVEISLYGITQETYEAITQIPGSFERCLKGIRRLLERRIPLTLKTPGLTLNAEEIPRIKAFAASVGAHFKFDADVHPRLDGNKAPLALRLTPDQVVEIEHQDPDMREEWRFRIENECGAISPPSDLVFPCSVDKSSFYIAANGRMIHCNYTRSPSRDLREIRVEEGFEGVESDLRRLKQPVDVAPHSCGSPKTCMRCPGRALLEAGDSTKPVEYFCDVTEKRVSEKEGLYQEASGHAHL